MLGRVAIPAVQENFPGSAALERDPVAALLAMLSAVKAEQTKKTSH